VSYSNLQSTSQTIAAQIYNSLNEDKQLSTLFQSPRQILLQPPSGQAKTAKPQISLCLYNVTQMQSMRNQTQPPNSNAVSPLLYLNLHYLITPQTGNAEDDQDVLGRILQLFAEKPVLHGEALQGNLADGEALRVVFEELSIEELSKLWGLFGVPFQLSVAFRVYPVRLDSSVKPPVKPMVVAAKPVVPVKVLRSNLGLKASLKR
jgi:hypothetical protein